MRDLRSYKILHIAIMAYMLAAFAWWAILLNKKTTENYHLKNRILHLDKSYSVQTIQEEYDTQKKMIIGEGLVFGISILIGLYLINRAYQSEIKTNKSLNNFLLSVTHELKTPIASLNLINRTLATKNLTPEKSKSLLDSAYDESQRMESLVDNILTAAQIEHSYTYNYEQVNLSELIAKRINKLNNPIATHQITFDKSGDITAKLDREAYTSIVDNLLTNAAKYSPADSKIEVNISQNDKSTVLQVSDNGIGITDHEKKMVLQKFYRVGNEEVRETKGTGLGLYIVQQIVKAHNGKIKILDHKPRGTTFEVSIPNR